MFIISEIRGNPFSDRKVSDFFTIHKISAAFFFRKPHECFSDAFPIPLNQIKKRDADAACNRIGVSIGRRGLSFAPRASFDDYASGDCAGIMADAEHIHSGAYLRQQQRRVAFQIVAAHDDAALRIIQAYAVSDEAGRYVEHIVSRHRIHLDDFRHGVSHAACEIKPDRYAQI